MCNILLSFKYIVKESGTKILGLSKTHEADRQTRLSQTCERHCTC
jgi:hypothetical protein